MRRTTSFNAVKSGIPMMRRVLRLSSFTSHQMMLAAHMHDKYSYFARDIYQDMSMSEMEQYCKKSSTEIPDE